MSIKTIETKDFSQADIIEINCVKYVREDKVIEMMEKSAINFGEFLRQLTPIGDEDSEEKWLILQGQEFHHKTTKEAFDIYNKENK